MPRIHHVNVVVSPGGTEAALSFWGGVLGLRRIDKPAVLDPSGAWFEVDGLTQIHVSERDGQPHPSAHVALVVDDFPALLERLAAAGAEFTPAEDLFGGARGFTRDPAGNRVELLERSGELA